MKLQGEIVLSKPWKDILSEYRLLCRDYNPARIIKMAAEGVRQHYQDTEEILSALNNCEDAQKLLEDKLDFHKKHLNDIYSFLPQG